MMMIIIIIIIGTINSTNRTNAFCGKCKHLTPKSLKHQLKQIKMNNAPLQKIKHVSQLLRSKLKNQDSTHSSATAVNQDRYVSKNLWGFVKNVIEKGSAVLSSFSRDHCTRFFIAFFAAILPYKKFTIPHWIPSFNQLSSSFDQSAPSYDKGGCQADVFGRSLRVTCNLALPASCPGRRRLNRHPCAHQCREGDWVPSRTKNNIC